MRKTFLFLLLFYAVTCSAQYVYPWDDHIFPFCTDENPYGITYKSGTTGLAGFPKKDRIGCLGSSPAPIWYYMQIDQPGDLLIYIEQYSTIQKKQLLDVDFICWGPFQAKSKKDFLKKLKESYKLNVSEHPTHSPSNGDHSTDNGGYPYRNMVDCSFSALGTEWCFIPNAKSGEWYLLMITNYSRQPGEIHFERVNSMSTATTRCDVTLPVTINPIPKDLKQINDHTSAICMDEEEALVTIELESDDEFTLSKKDLQETTVKVYSNGKTYETTLVDGHFECIIDIKSDTTSYYAQVSCPDPEFELQTENYYLVRSKDCIPGITTVNQLDTIHAGKISFTELKQGDKPITVSLPDEEDYKNINLDDYEIEVINDNPFIESVSVSHEGNDLKLWPKLRGDWCECFIPDSLTFHLKLVRKNQSDLADYIDLPVTIKVENQSMWIRRCLWVLLTIAGLIVFLLYLWGLLKKNRFKKSGRIKERHLELNGSRWVMTDWKSGRLLREKGFAAWVNRWLVPFRDERRTLNWTTSPPHAGSITFVAAELKNKVYMTRESFNATKMRMASFDPNNKNDKRKLLKVDPISIYGNGRCEGELKYDGSGKDNEKYFRIVVVILMVLSAAAILSLLFLMLKSIF